MPEEKKDPKELRAKLDSKADQMWRNLTEDVNPTFGLAWSIATSDKYGERDRDVFDKYIYKPTLNSDKGGKVLADTLKESRQDGQFLSGQVTERQIAQRGHKITLDSLAGIKVGQALDLMDINQEDRRDLKLDMDKYLAEYLNEEDEVAKARVIEIMGKYFAYKIGQDLSKAYKLEQEDIVKNLKNDLTSNEFAKKAKYDADVNKYKKIRAEELGLAA